MADLYTDLKDDLRFFNVANQLASVTPLAVLVLDSYSTPWPALTSVKVLAIFVDVLVMLVKYCEMSGAKLCSLTPMNPGKTVSCAYDMDPNRLPGLACDSAGRKELNSPETHLGQFDVEGCWRFQLGFVFKNPGVVSQESPMRWVRAQGQAFFAAR